MKIAQVQVALGALAISSGVALGAVAAHAGSDPRMAFASQFALIMGAAVIAGSAAIEMRLAHARFGQLALWAILLGMLLFCGDLALKAADIGALFPMAAPTGGMLMIAGWIAFAATAVFRRS